MKYRKLRISWSVAWATIAVLLCVGWPIALSFSEFAANRFNAAGVLTTIAFNRGSLAYSRYDTTTLAPNAFAMTLDDQRIYSSSKPFWWKFGRNIHKSPSQGFLFQSSKVYTVFRAPYWTLAVPSALLAGIPWLPRRFSVRALLIATTLIAVGLGLIAWEAG